MYFFLFAKGRETYIYISFWGEEQGSVSLTIYHPRFTVSFNFFLKKCAVFNSLI